MEEFAADESGDLIVPVSGSAGLDELFEVLSNERRRRVIRYVNEHGTPIALADLADEVAALEDGASIDETEPEAVERVYVSLYHAHVPKLADAGLVEYDRERDLVAPPASDEVLDRALDLATAGD